MYDTPLLDARGHAHGLACAKGLGGLYLSCNCDDCLRCAPTSAENCLSTGPKHLKIMSWKRCMEKIGMVWQKFAVRNTWRFTGNHAPVILFGK